MLKLEIRESEGGALIPVKVRAGGHRNMITGIHAGRLKIEVCAAPEKGKANRAVLECLANYLSVARSKLEVVAGKTASLKTIAVRDWTVDDNRMLLWKKLKVDE